MSHNYMKPLGNINEEKNEVNVLIPNSIDSITVETTITNENIGVDKPALLLKNINHTFDAGTEHEYKIFDNFTLEIKDNPGKSEIISIMGGSGCGKSCLLRMAAGLMTPQSGEIYIHGESIKEYKSVPMVFQSYSSYEWMTVLDNVALPLIIKGVSKKEAREKAMEMIKLVGLEQHATKYAKSSVLSGGQLQRVSIARCLASGSKVILLDEATSGLDINLKRGIQDLILKICNDSGLERTIINVSHSLEECLYISNKILVLKGNPCSIVKEMDIDYGEKRGRWVFESSDKYRQYSKELSACLDEVCM